MRTSFLKIALFALIVSAPVAALSFGVVAPYGQTAKHPDFPKFKRLLQGRGKAFDSLGEAILHRSVVTAEVIRLHSLIGYQRTHFVDIASIVSGRDGWLFYKGDFRACYDDADTASALAQVDVMTDLAKSAGLDMVVSISPDKSVIYPEYLHPLAKYYWACKAAARQSLDKHIKIEAPRIVDHAQVLESEHALHPERKLYYDTDTHWTFYGAALAYRQLMAALSGQAYESLPPPHPTGKLLTRTTDMTVTLMVPRDETADEIDPVVENKIASIDTKSAQLKTIMLHDSFYEFIQSYLTNQLHYEFFHIELEKDKYPAEIATADRLIINSVERFFISRIRKDELSWDAPLAKAILARNMDHAKKCADYADIGPVSAGDDGKVALALPAKNGAKSLCLRLTLESDTAGHATMLLPMKQDGNVFEAGRSFPIEVTAGKQVVDLLLPDYLAGKSIRLDTGGSKKAHISLQSAQTGQLASSS